ncbi:recombinase family protein [Alkaliphilus crotonatoxidans]
MELKNKGLSGKLIKIFIDDNASGYTLDRPEFNQLRIRSRQWPDKAHIVIAKDSSRIGRHNAKTLLFFELLQEHGVRIILASDGYDSEKDNDDVLGIKTWYNEMYVKDISRKIRDSIHSKQKNGGLIVKNIYGYEKCPVININW